MRIEGRGDRGETIGEGRRNGGGKEQAEGGWEKDEFHTSAAYITHLLRILWESQSRDPL